MSIELTVSGNLAKDVIFDEIHFGGSAGNIAINASFFGIKSAIVSNCGKDQFSDQYLNYLRNCGVDSSLIKMDLESLPSCVVTSEINHSSSKEWIDNGSSEALNSYLPTQAEAETITQSRIIHMTTTPLALAKRLIALASTNAIIGYEPGPQFTDDSSYFDMDLFKKADFLFLNEEEFTVLEECIGVSALQRVMTQRQVIILSRGEKGSRIYHSDYQIDYDVDEVIAHDNIVDSNGAGDAYKSGFYYSLLRRNDLALAVKMGNRFGAAIVSQRGSILNNTNILSLKNS